MSKEAIRIYGHVLDALTRHLCAGNAEGCLTYLSLPFRMQLLDRTHVCVTHADVAHLVADYAAYMEEMKLTELRRTVEDARFVTPDHIVGYHITEPLSDGTPIADAYAFESHLVRRGDRWVSTEQDVIVQNRSWQLVPGRRRRDGQAKS